MDFEKLKKDYKALCDEFWWGIVVLIGGSEGN